jgi:hypothetical protein
MIDDDWWAEFDRNGFASLGQVVSAADVAALAKRADDLATGRAVHPNLQFQLDTGGAYDDLSAAVDRLAEPTLLYRKIQGLEHDDLFRNVLDLPIVREVCARMYGPHSGTSIFRAMIMNKPAGQGTILPWHQDGGDVWGLDRDPLVTLWLAIDPATSANGCVEVIPGSHRLGVLSSYGSTLTDESAAQHCSPDRVVPMLATPGEMFLLHNWTIHRSGVNPSTQPRRAFTTCLMDARTISVSTGNRFPLLHGVDQTEPYPFVRQHEIDGEFLRDSHARAEEYAHSLEAEVAKLRAALTPP